jgi:hypothetical protein
MIHACAVVKRLLGWGGTWVFRAFIMVTRSSQGCTSYVSPKSSKKDGKHSRSNFEFVTLRTSSKTGEAHVLGLHPAW